MVRVLFWLYEKEQNVFNFYSNLLEECLDGEHAVNLEELNMPRSNLAELYAPFTEEEVWKTIRSLPSDKASGPDGFTGKFYNILNLVSIWKRVESPRHTLFV